MPWLMRQAISFKLKNTSYRNIPFRFSAKRRYFYILTLFTVMVIVAYIIVAVIVPQLAPLIGLVLFLFALPLLYRSYKHLIINNTWYGNAPFAFSTTRREMIGLFFRIALWNIFISLLLALTALLITKAATVIGVTDSFDIRSFAKESFGSIALTLFGTVVYLFNLGLYKGAIDALLSNFTRNHTTLNSAKFKGTLHPLKLAWISASNAILLLFSLGLLYPWTRVRYLKYKMENSFFACSNYDDFISSGFEKSNPLGEEALDFFDIDIGF